MVGVLGMILLLWLLLLLSGVAAVVVGIDIFLVVGFVLVV